MAERAKGGRTLPPAGVLCPRCGGAVDREGISVEEARASCPWCRRGLDLAAPAAAVRGDPGRPAAGPLPCRQCGAEVPAASVELHAGLARCPSCGTVLDLASGRNADWFRRLLGEKEGVPLPGSFRVRPGPGGVTLSVPVSRWIALPPAGLLWRIVALVAFLAIGAVLIPDREVRIAGASVAAAALLYAALLALLRRTVSVRGEDLILGWRPIPLPSRRVPGKGIRQVFVEYRDIDREGDPDLRAISPAR